MNGHAGQRRAWASATKRELQMTALVGNRAANSRGPDSYPAQPGCIPVPHTGTRHSARERSSQHSRHRPVPCSRARRRRRCGSARMSRESARITDAIRRTSRARPARRTRPSNPIARTASTVGPSSRKTQAGSTSGGALRSSPRMTSLEPPATPVCDTTSGRTPAVYPRGTRRTRDPGTRSATFGAVNMAKDAIRWTIGL